MKFNKSILSRKEMLDEENIKYPSYNVDEVKKNTLENPMWLHCGGGNIFRGYLGSKHQMLLNNKIATEGIIVAEGFDYEIADIMNEYEDLTLNVKLKNTGEVDLEVIGSIVEYLKMDTASESFEDLVNIIKSPSLQMVSFTITEKGYSLTKSNGEYTQTVSEDFITSPEQAKSYVGKVVYLLYERYLNGKLPIALVSMDNLSQNGDVLKEAVITFAQNWAKNELVDDGFVHYLQNESFVSYPWTMIDKITPRPDNKVETLLKEKGFEDISPRLTNLNSYVAPFVNGEETEYLVIEDKFPNGRPKLEETGIIFTDRETVNLTERMKVTACLNPLHTALAIYGCLLGYESIYEEMEDADLLKLIHQLGYIEGLPTVIHPGILSPKEFIDEVIEVRLPNPFIPDTPQRIVTDTSQKLSTRFGHTLTSHIKENGDASSLIAIPLVYAGWLRYLMGVDDQDEEMLLSPDPLLDELELIFNKIQIGDQVDEEQITTILEDETIFGENLTNTSLGNEVISLFKQMIVGPGAVRETLQKTLSSI